MLFCANDKSNNNDNNNDKNNNNDNNNDKNNNNDNNNRTITLKVMHTC